MDPVRFIQIWRNVDLTERSASQQHFLDLCELVDHQKPAEADPTGEWFTFEKGAAKHGGGDGWADVWKKGFFAWEYKGKHKNLDAAYDQLLEYREALESPPLLVVSDMDRIIVRTNFTATPTVKHEIALSDLAEPRSLEILRAVFHHPDRLRPGRTSQAITAEAAERIAEIAQGMRNRGLDPQKVAHFLDRIVFCLFAEDIELLPEGLFSRLVEHTRDEPKRFGRTVGNLFDAMAEGGEFGEHTIRNFDGSLFARGPVLEMTDDEIDRIYEASRLDWGAVDPSIFGTLFERGMDPDKRSQIGAHYTSREDIETLVEPVVMWPLRREWGEIRQTVDNLLATGRKSLPGAPGQGADQAPKKPPSKAVRTRSRNESERLVRRFHEKLTMLRVLDPACGSGNFLYVTLQKLKDLEKEVIVFLQDRLGAQAIPMVGPWQLFGIEISPYAHDLAQMVVWIGYLQWVKANGFGTPTEPILKPMAGNFQCRDAILDLSDPESPKEPDWPRVDYIVGNPPFLGDKLMRGALGDGYVDALRSLYEGRIPGQSDLCCYWFEKARGQIEKHRCQRAGLLATQGIRGGANRKVLQRIKETGDIFFAESDRPWILDGANVHVSMAAFDDSSEEDRVLNGTPVGVIYANLLAGAEVSSARPMHENAGTSFIGAAVHGPFYLEESRALAMVTAPNPAPSPNSDVVRPYANGLTVTQQAYLQWIVDFRPDTTVEQAALYEAPFAFVKEDVLPIRARNRRESRRKRWWILGDPQKAMRKAKSDLARVIVTPRVSKHRVFIWLKPEFLLNDALVVFAREDDYFFGVLHSRLHEVWALKLGTRLETRPRYTPTTCFETFPFPWPPCPEQGRGAGAEPADNPLVRAIAEAARELNELRERWLNPPEWTVTEVLEFPGSVDGPWARYVHEPDQNGVGTVRYPRIVDNGVAPSRLKKRTLTNLYNEMPTWLRNAHGALDEAVCAAYAATTGDPAWKPDMTDEQILEKLLELNLARAAQT